MVWKERRWWWFSWYPSVRSLVSFSAILAHSLSTIVSISLLCELHHFAVIRFPRYRVSAIFLRVISLWFQISQGFLRLSIVSSQFQIRIFRYPLWSSISLTGLVPVNKCHLLLCSSAVSIHLYLFVLGLHPSSSAFILSLSRLSISFSQPRSFHGVPSLWSTSFNRSHFLFQHFDLFASPPGLLDVSIESHCFSIDSVFILVSISCITRFPFVAASFSHDSRIAYSQMFSLQLFHVVLKFELCVGLLNSNMEFVLVSSWMPNSNTEWSAVILNVGF